MLHVPVGFGESVVLESADSCDLYFFLGFLKARSWFQAGVGSQVQ